MSVLEGPPPVEAYAEAGFSLVETLIAALLFLVVVVGMLPLFLSSITNNNAGNDYLHATNFARSDLEQLHKLPFTDPNLTIAGGSTSTTRTDYFAQNPLLTGVGQWLTTATAAAPPLVLWQRSATVRQYSADALARQLRMAGRGGLPQDKAIAVRDNVGLAGAQGNILVGVGSSPLVARGSDVITMRGVMASSIYQVNYSDSTVFTAPDAGGRGK